MSEAREGGVGARLAAVEAERDALKAVADQMSRVIWWVLQSDGDIVFTDDEIAEFGEPAAIECVREDGDTLTVIRAIAPQRAEAGESVLRPDLKAPAKSTRITSGSV